MPPPLAHQAGPARRLTAVQQLPHHGEVGVGHGVVQRGVTVAVGNVDHIVQQPGRHGPEGDQMSPYKFRVCVTAAGQAQPFLKYCGIGYFLDRDSRSGE